MTTVIAACADVPAAFGPTPAAARANADGLFGSLDARFTNVSRTPRYARAREMLGRYALTPSTLYNDSTVWTAFGADGTRTLFGEATTTDGHYVFTNVPSNAALNAPGDGRHIVRLRKLSDSDYEWFTGVDFATGHITASDFGDVITRWLTSAEGRDQAAIRADYISAFPRTTAALGKLFRLDTLISVRGADGVNTLYVGVHMTPDGIRATLPEYAQYVDKYATRVKLRFSLVDARGAQWVDGAMRDGNITLKLRSQGGHFAPFEGPARQIPDTLALHMDMTAKISLFTVGVDRLTGEWVNVRAAHERGWSMRFTKEPGWVLPPAVGFLLRSPLRRPFDGAGTLFRVTIRDEAGQQTLISRRTTTVVRESAILKFLGKLSGSVMGEFVSKAEEQENRFNATVFSALKADVDAALR
ncbi:MAG: hypothetical protein ACR2MQ_12095 [Gemmatimonadaceae bacterium]